LFGFLSDLFEAPEIATSQEIKKAFANPKVVVVDVRSPAEITAKIDAKKWINAPGTPFNCPILSEQATSLIPDKSAPIILYCVSGKRAQKAANILREQGFENVLNAGGIAQLQFLPIKTA
jgi:phage shock protein E